MIKLLLLSFLPIIAFAQSNSTASIETYMSAYASVRQFSGSALVVKQGKVIYEKAFGEADKEWQIKNTNQTKYRIGSNTKQFTAACILKLHEQGKIKLDDKLSKYLPSYPKGDSVTVHMLLTHTSGITDYTNLDAFWNTYAYVPIQPDSFISVFKNKPYDFSPGTQCSYSNSGYYLLGIIIEKASGESYSDYLYKNILNPAGLKDTGFDQLDAILEFRSRGYYSVKDKYYNAPYITMEGPWSAGALYSTGRDLYNWSKALYTNKILTAESVKKMTTPYARNADNEPFGYGLIIDSLKSHKRIWHNGGIPGFTSYIAFYPADDTHVIVLSNNSSNTTNIGTGLAYLLYNYPIEIPYVHKEIKILPNELEKFVGKYDAPT
ncbi:MAG: beta-lactamase family protein, partial [Sediminibacterium sp.]|nr:beta-lactamase family protein [Sediminibacterium sp.]